MYSSRVFLFLLCLIVWERAHSTVTLPDSIRVMKDDTLKVKTLREYAFDLSAYDHAKALDVVALIKTLSTQLQFQAGQAMALDIEANINRSEGDYNKAVVLHQQALALLDIHRNQRYYISILVNLGTDYSYLENLPKAIQFYQQALSLVKPEDPRYITIHNNIGNVYSMQGKHNEAIQLYQKVLPQAQTDSSYRAQSSLYSSIGIAYTMLHQSDKAIQYLKQALVFQQLSGSVIHYAATCNTIATTYIDIKQYALAQQYLDNGYEAALRINARSVIANYYRNMGLLCRETNRWKEAYLWQEKFITLHDSLISESHVDELAESETKFNMEMKDRELNLVKAENKLKESELGQASMWRWLLTLTIVVMCGFAGLLYRNSQLRKKTNRVLSLENAQLQSENVLAQYETLRSQINPHFLFNSLNALHSLIVSDAEKATHFVSVFSRLYRSVLEQKDNPVIRLSEELQLVDDYIYLQQIRFGDSLKLHKKIDAHVLQYCIPPFCIQMLIENAIKHNTIEPERPLTIHLYTEKNNLIVSNSLQVRTQKNHSTGVGIQNIKARFQLLHDEVPVFEMRNNQYIVSIPLIQPA